MFKMKPDPLYRRIIRELVPIDPHNRLRMYGFMLMGGLFGVFLAIGMVFGGGHSPLMGLFYILLAVLIFLVFFFVFHTISEAPAMILWGRGRPVDQRQLKMETQLDLARTAERNRHFRQAVDLYRQLLLENLSDSPEWIWFQIGRIQHEYIVDHHRATYAFRKVIQRLKAMNVDPEDGSGLGAIYRDSLARLNVLADRVEQVEKGIAARRDEVTSLVENGDIGAARALVDRLHEDDPDDAENNFLKGFVISRLGSYGLGIEYYRRAIELDPDHLRARYNLAAALDAMEEEWEAAEAYETYIEAAGDSPLEVEWVDQAKLQLARLKHSINEQLPLDSSEK